MTPGYSVRRRRWQSPRGDATFPSPARGMYHRRRPGSEVVATFPDYAAAAADALERERAVWLAPGFNPFAYGGPLPLLTSLPEPILHDWLLDRGHEPPGAGFQWGAWFAKGVADPWAVREGLDKLRFYEVARARTPAYVVLERVWGRIHLQGRLAQADCGRPARAFADRAAADRDCTERTVRARAMVGADPGEYSAPYYEVMGAPVGLGDAADYFAVAAVDGPAAGWPRPGIGHLVTRRRVGEWVAGVPPTSVGGPAGEPAALAPDRAAADAMVGELEAQARAALNPFACHDCDLRDTELFRRLADVAAELRGPDLRGRAPFAVLIRLANWYDRRARLLTADERARLWDCFPGPVYSVEEVACG